MDEATKAEMKALINDSMKLHTNNIIQVTAANTLKAIDTQIKENKKELREDFDTQLQECSKVDHSFKNNINESNYEFCKELNDVWRKTERAIKEKNTAPEMS